MDFKTAIKHEDNDEPVSYQGNQYYVVGHNELLGTSREDGAMNWKAFYGDLYEWMQASNVMLQRDGFDSDQYWQWLIDTLGVIERRYNQHPLVVSILTDIAKYQDEQYKKLHKEGL